MGFGHLMNDMERINKMIARCSLYNPYAWIPEYKKMNLAVGDRFLEITKADSSV